MPSAKAGRVIKLSRSESEIEERAERGERETDLFYLIMSIKYATELYFLAQNTTQYRYTPPLLCQHLSAFLVLTHRRQNQQNAL